MVDIFGLLVGDGGYILAGVGWWWMVLNSREHYFWWWWVGVDGGGWWWVVAWFSLTQIFPV